MKSATNRQAQDQARHSLLLYKPLKVSMLFSTAITKSLMKYKRVKGQTKRLSTYMKKGVSLNCSPEANTKHNWCQDDNGWCQDAAEDLPLVLPVHIYKIFMIIFNKLYNRNST